MLEERRSTCFIMEAPYQSACIHYHVVGQKRCLIKVDSMPCPLRLLPPPPFCIRNSSFFRKRCHAPPSVPWRYWTIRMSVDVRGSFFLKKNVHVSLWLTEDIYVFYWCVSAHCDVMADHDIEVVSGKKRGLWHWKTIICPRMACFSSSPSCRCFVPRCLSRC